MDLLSLRYFQAVARREHISRAAEDLRVAQPSLSRTIARLEREVGVPLFDRHGRTIRLNRFGAGFLRRVDRALSELEDGRRELVDAVGLERGKVALAAETLFQLAEVLHGFVAAYPGVDVQLYQSSADRMAEQLRTGEVDLCLASQPVTGDRLASQEIVREEVLLGVPTSHPLAQRTRVSLDEIANEPFITTRAGYWSRTLADRMFGAAGLRPNIVCEGDELGATAYLIGTGLGVGLLPSVARDASTLAPVAWVPIDAPGCERTLSVVWREDSYLSAAAAALRDFVSAYYDDRPDDSVRNTYYS